ncbi:MAG: 3-oxoacid CoA-transferase subunit B [Clostridia bacterium]|nr:3-oxoacid CoA-transferase subunit B [Clostridia bacterium]
MPDVKRYIAKRVAKEVKDGYVMNLGVGMPTLVADYVSPDVTVFLQAEHGIVGAGPFAAPGNEDAELIDAGGGHITVKPGAAFFDSPTSFALIRGGHVDVTVLGALQVDKEGNLANWMVPGKKVPGMGGAMDLVVGAKKVIIAMEHTAKGAPKILNKCTFPLTAVNVVDMIVTEMGVMDVTDKGIILKEINPAYTVEQVQAATEAELIVADGLKFMEPMED